MRKMATTTTTTACIQQRNNEREREIAREMEKNKCSRLARTLARPEFTPSRPKSHHATSRRTWCRRAPLVQHGMLVDFFAREKKQTK